MSVRHARVEQFIAIVALGSLGLGCLLVIRPFFSPLLWASILVFATWPFYAWLLERLGQRRTLTAAIMAVLLALAFVAPLVALGRGVGDNLVAAIDWVRRSLETGLPPAPAWVETIPLVGSSITAYWATIVADNSILVERLQPLFAPARRLALDGGLALGSALIEVGLSVFISFFLYRDGPGLLTFVQAVGKRIAGDRIKQYIDVVKNTVNGVVYGIIGTAIVQGLLAAIGFMIAGVPNPIFLGFVTFILALVPVATPLAWAGATIWLVYQGDIVWAVFMGLWGFFVISGVDNLIRPILISRGANLSFIVVLLGILGGLIAFGFLGLFLGPVLLAVGTAILREWAREGERTQKIEQDNHGTHDEPSRN